MSPIRIDSVFYELALHDTDFAAALRKSVANLDQLDGGAKKAGQGIGHLENGMKSAGKAASSLTSDFKRLAAGLTIGLALRAFIANTIEAQNALAQLTAAVKSTGGAAGFTVPELDEMSQALSKISTFSDEAVKGGLSRLLTYTGIQGPMFREAARAALDMAAALRIDMTSAAEKVGNALQYPTEAINSLTKQGFRFTAEQKRLIAGFESTGQLAKAQAIILGELDLAYKGSAEAARNTLGGALIALKNAFTDTLEVSKESSSGIIGAINSIAEAMPAVSKASNWFFTQMNLGFIEMGISVEKANIAMAKFQLRAASFLFKIPGLKEFAWNQSNIAMEVLGTDQGASTLAALEKLREEQVAKALGLGAAAPTARGTPAGTTPKGLTDQQLAAQKSARLGFEAAIAGQTTGGVDNFETQVTKLVAAAQKAHLGATEIQKMVAELRSAHAEALAKDSAKLAGDLQKQLADLTVTMADDLQSQLDAFDAAIAEAKKKGLTVDPALVEQLRGAKQEAIEAAPKIEEIATALERINQSTAQGFNLSGALAEMNTLIDSATALRDAAPLGSPARAAAQERLNALIAREAEIRKQLRTIMLATADTSTKIAANIESVSGGIANAANAAFGLASAFLGVNSNITKALGSIGQMAGGISDVSGLATKAGGFGSLFSSAGGIASAIPGIGQAIGGAMALASTLFATSPEEIERLRVLKENNVQLSLLRDRIGDLAKINVTGTQLGQIQQFANDPRLQALINNPSAPFMTQDVFNRQIGAILDSLGLSSAEFKKIAESFGITVGTGSGGKITFADIQQVIDAITNSELSQFADDFTGQMQKLDAEIKLFDLKEPIDQFNAFRRALAGVSGGTSALSKLLDGFDLSTAQGIDAARTAIQEMFTTFQTLEGADLATFLGGLTPQQFIDALSRATDFINGAAGSGGLAGTGGFNVSRTITEVTGNRLEALLSSELIFAEQTARNTAVIAQLMGGGNLPVINTPSLSPFGAGSAGPMVVIESLTVNLSGLTDPARAQEVGAAVGGSILEEIDRGLGKRAQFARLSRGVLS